MAFTKERKFAVYRKLLERFCRGEYISKVRENVDISRDMVNKYCKSLSEQGYIFLTSGEKGRTFVNFTNKGKELLKEYFGDQPIM